MAAAPIVMDDDCLPFTLQELFESRSIRVNCLCPAYVDTELLRDGLATGIPSFIASVEKIGLMRYLRMSTVY